MVYNIILMTLFLSLTFLYISWIFTYLTRQPKKEKSNFSPGISVIIPAHNEEGVIKSTIESIFNSSYPGDMEVIVVNDGSTDRTEEIVDSIKDKRLKLFRTDHVGKGRAINFGVTKSSYNYLLFLDADSSVGEDSIQEVVDPLRQTGVGASSGIIRAKLKINPLTWFQDLEYILSSAWRFISSLMGTASVLPGFFSVKKDVFNRAGGFSPDTLTEDFDIALEIKKIGYDSTVVPEAVIYTETPTNFKSLIRQRIRWGRGTLQVLKKHSNMIFSRKFGTLGFLTIPTHLYWYIFSLLYLPAVLYWMIGDYYRYFASSGNILSFGAGSFLFKWITTYGMYDLIIKVLTGTYALNPLLLISIINFLVTLIYNFLVFSRLGGIKLRTLFAYFFSFPYYLFIFFVKCLAVFYEGYYFVFGKKSGNVWDK